MKWFIIIILILIFTISCTYQQDIIKIGAILEDDSAKNGIDLAIKEVNQRNTLNTPVRVIFEEISCNAREADSAAVKLVLADGIRAIIGDVCSEATAVVAKVAKQNTAVLINLADTSEVNDYMFNLTSEVSPVFAELYRRVYNTTATLDAAQGYDAVKLIVETLQEVDYTGAKLKEALSASD